MESSSKANHASGKRARMSRAKRKKAIRESVESLDREQLLEVYAAVGREFPEAVPASFADSTELSMDSLETKDLVKLHQLVASSVSGLVRETGNGAARDGEEDETSRKQKGAVDTNEAQEEASAKKTRVSRKKRRISIIDTLDTLDKRGFAKVLADIRKLYPAVVPASSSKQTRAMDLSFDSLKVADLAKLQELVESTAETLKQDEQNQGDRKRKAEEMATVGVNEDTPQKKKRVTRKKRKQAIESALSTLDQRQFVQVLEDIREEYPQVVPLTASGATAPSLSLEALPMKDLGLLHEMVEAAVETMKLAEGVAAQAAAAAADNNKKEARGEDMDTKLKAEPATEEGTGSVKKRRRSRKKFKRTITETLATLNPRQLSKVLAHVRKQVPEAGGDMDAEVNLDSLALDDLDKVQQLVVEFTAETLKEHEAKEALVVEEESAAETLKQLEVETAAEQDDKKKDDKMKTPQNFVQGKSGEEGSAKKPRRSRKKLTRSMSETLSALDRNQLLNVLARVRREVPGAKGGTETELSLSSLPIDDLERVQQLVAESAAEALKEQEASESGVEEEEDGKKMSEEAASAKETEAASAKETARSRKKLSRSISETMSTLNHAQLLKVLDRIRQHLPEAEGDTESALSLDSLPMEDLEKVQQLVESAAANLKLESERADEEGNKKSQEMDGAGAVAKKSRRSRKKLKRSITEVLSTLNGSQVLKVFAEVRQQIPEARGDSDGQLNLESLSIDDLEKVQQLVEAVSEALKRQANEVQQQPSAAAIVANDAKPAQQVVEKEPEAEPACKDSAKKPRTPRKKRLSLISDSVAAFSKPQWSQVFASVRDNFPAAVPPITTEHREELNLDGLQAQELAKLQQFLEEAAQQMKEEDAGGAAEEVESVEPALQDTKPAAVRRDEAGEPPRKKQRRKSGKRYSSKPEPGMAGFFLYAQYNCDRVAASLGDVVIDHFGPVAIALKEEYDSLSAEKKQLWTESAGKLDLAADHKTMAKYERSLKQKNPEAPKRNLSAYVLWSMANRPRVTRENPTATPAEVMKLLASAFKTLPTEERAIWDSKSAQDRERYQQEMQAFKKREQEEEGGDAASQGGDHDESRGFESRGGDMEIAEDQQEEVHHDLVYTDDGEDVEC